MNLLIETCMKKMCLPQLFFRRITYLLIPWFTSKQTLNIFREDKSIHTKSYNTHSASTPQVSRSHVPSASYFMDALDFSRFCEITCKYKNIHITKRIIRTSVKGHSGNSNYQTGISISYVFSWGQTGETTSISKLRFLCAFLSEPSN